MTERYHTPIRFSTVRVTGEISGLSLGDVEVLNLLRRKQHPRKGTGTSDVCTSLSSAAPAG